MNLAKMTNKNLIVLDVSVATKEEAIRLLIDKLYKENIISSKEKFFDTVMEREKHSPTGLERGLAIPHGKCDSVNRSAFAVARLNNKINDWESIDESNEVDLVFLLAIPKSEKETTHLKLLSELSVALMDENFYNDLSISKNADEFLKNLNRSDKEEKDTNKYDKTVLVVTACAAGIAHTYMSAEALEKVGKEMGIKVISEKQGASGIEDRHTKEQIQKADGVIFACDVAVKNIERYQGKSFVKVRVAEPLKHSKNLLNKVLQNPDGKVEVLSNEEAFTSTYELKQGTLKEMMEAVMTGISYMIPVIVSAGLMMGIAKLTAVAIGQIDNMGTFIESGNTFYELLGYLDMFGSMIFKFIYPIFSAYVAYSIADRPALVPGFVGGAFAGGLHFTFWGVEGGVPSGFIGALILGLVAGYVTRFLNENIKLNKNLQAMKPMFLLPGITMLVIFLLNFYAVDPAFGRVNAFIANIIESFGTASTIALTVVIAACTAFDLGGPVNKAAGAIAIGLAADG
ncbi:fructose PTS transporter subunit IIA, partial [Clostridioides difficile]